MGLAADELKREADRARRTAARIEAEWPLHGPGPVTGFVHALGARLGQGAGRSRFPWRFSVFRHRDANAFAIGGGRIYVSDGSIVLCQSEAELAAIIAHEMGHQIAGHFRGKSAPERAPSGRRSRDQRVGSVIQEYDLAKEMEADRISLRVLRAAGYAPRAALDIATRLAQAGQGRSQSLAQERLDALASLLRGVPSTGRTDSERYRALRQQLRETELPDPSGP